MVQGSTKPHVSVEPCLPFHRLMLQLRFTRSPLNYGAGERLGEGLPSYSSPLVGEAR